MTTIMIVGAKRTPMGNLLGDLKDVSAPQLGATALKASLKEANIAPENVDEIFMGCVLSAGIGQAPARQAAITAGIPVSVGATTLNKMCGSGMKAVMLANDLLLAGSGQVIAAGGMESMTNAPYLLSKARSGYRLGHGALIDHLFFDGLEDAYDKGKLMGVFAENCAKEYKFSREAQDEFAINSLRRAQEAIKQNDFKAEICPVTVTTKTGEIIIDTDETPLKAKIDKIPLLKPAFDKAGTVTAANSSSISDGAAALILTTNTYAKDHDLKPIAKIVGHTTYSQDPALFTTAPIFAIKKLLKKINWQIDDVDLFEINEAFAVVTMSAIHDLKLPKEKVNISGGACALGHPIGASGARILVTLIHALKRQGKRKGIAALCIGGGEATAMAIELCD